MYNCKYCNASFETKNELGGHVSHCEHNPKNTEVNTCEFCGKQLFGRKSYTQHVNHCNNNPNKKIYNDSALYESPQNCKYCNKLCKNSNSLRNHERLCKNNPDRQIFNTTKHTRGWPKGKPGWSSGLTKETDLRVANCSNQLNEYYKTHEGTFKGKHHSDETKTKLREFAIENESHKNFGRHKNFVYKGVNFQSSYELTVAKDLDLHNIRWESAKRLPYIDNKGLNHYYTADLYLPDYDVYLDPKNDFLIENINPYFGYKDVDKIKWVCEQNNVKIIILNKDELAWPMIEQIIKQYGE